MDTPESIIPDDEIERVHGASNFGGMAPRAVVNEATLKYAMGYESGSTVREIMRAHRLLRKHRYKKTSDLSMKGKRYLRAIVGGRFDEMAAIVAPDGRDEQ